MYVSAPKAFTRLAYIVKFIHKIPNGPSKGFVYNISRNLSSLVKYKYKLYKYVTCSF